MQKRNIKYLDFRTDFHLRKGEYLSSFTRVMESGIYVLSKEVETFEKKFAEYLGVKYCVGVANGLEAIQISLMALGVGKGDEVITTPVSAVATTLAILAVGAKPVFTDVDENGQMDVYGIEKLITKHTKAVLPVYLYGQPLEIGKVRRICSKHKLFLIEDAAQAHGATYIGKKLGSFGIISCFSFYPTKNMGAIGDGGALATNNLKLAEMFKILRDYGQKFKYVHTEFGLNSRLDELQAAMLSVKLKHLDVDNRKRRKIARIYISLLRNVHGVKMVLPINVNDSNYHLFVIRVEDRDALKKYLEQKGIPTLIHYPITIPDQPMFRGKYKSLKIPEARNFVKEVLSLPCYPIMKFIEVNFICKQLKAFYEGRSSR